MFSVKQKKVSLRFRQWRRKSYAAFHSIGRHITIGNVKNIVADTLLRKQKTIDVSVEQVSRFPDERSGEDPEDPPGEQKLASILVPVLRQPKNYGKKRAILCLAAGSKWPNVLLTAHSAFLF